MKNFTKILVSLCLGMSMFAVLAQQTDEKDLQRTGIRGYAGKVTLKYQQPIYLTSFGMGSDAPVSNDKDAPKNNWLSIELEFTTEPVARNAAAYDEKVKSPDYKIKPLEYFECLTVKYDVLMLISSPNPTSVKEGEWSSKAKDENMHRLVLFTGTEDYVYVPRDEQPHRVFSMLMPYYMRSNRVKPFKPNDAMKDFMVMVSLYNEKGAFVGGGAHMPKGGKLPEGLKKVFDGVKIPGKNPRMAEQFEYLKAMKSAFDALKKTKFLNAPTKENPDNKREIVCFEDVINRRGTVFQWVKSSNYETLSPEPITKKNAKKENKPEVNPAPAPAFGEPKKVEEPVAPVAGDNTPKDTEETN